jgi:hypothetical protein
LQKQRNFHETYAPGDVQPPSDRSTGLVFAGVALIVALLWRHDVLVFRWVLSAAGVLAIVSVIVPVLLKPLNFLWFRLGLLLHRLVNPAIMFAIFLVVFVPAGALMRIWHDPLRSRPRPGAQSYWICRRSEGPLGGSMRNQF